MVVIDRDLNAESPIPRVFYPSNCLTFSFMPQIGKRKAEINFAYANYIQNFNDNRNRSTF